MRQQRAFKVKAQRGKSREAGVKRKIDPSAKYFAQGPVDETPEEKSQRLRYLGLDK